MRSGEMSCGFDMAANSFATDFSWRRVMCIPLGVRGASTNFHEISRKSSIPENPSKLRFHTRKMAHEFWRIFKVGPQTPSDLLHVPSRVSFHFLSGWVQLRPSILSSWRWWSITELLLAHPPPLLSESLWGTSQCGFRGFPFPGFWGSWLFMAICYDLARFTSMDEGDRNCQKRRTISENVATCRQLSWVLCVVPFPLPPLACSGTKHLGLFLLVVGPLGSSLSHGCVLKGPTREPPTLAFLACTPTRKLFLHFTEKGGFKALFQHACS